MRSNIYKVLLAVIVLIFVGCNSNERENNPKPCLTSKECENGFSCVDQTCQITRIDGDQNDNDSETDNESDSIADSDTVNIDGDGDALEDGDVIDKESEKDYESPVIIAIAAGYREACALSNTRDLYCWGDNQANRLGGPTSEICDYDYNCSKRPLLVPNSKNIGPISVIDFGKDSANEFACFVNDRGVVYCGLGERARPVDGLVVEVVDVIMGGGHTCVLTKTGTGMCWGNNQDGQLGNGGTSYQSKPVAIVGLTNGIKSISAGGKHTCALTQNSTAYCWGDNSKGQLGDGTNTSHSEPVLVAGLPETVKAISAGANTSCALTENGLVYCWGAGNINPTTPTLVGGIQGRSIAVFAGLTSCAISALGSAACWGAQLGTDSGSGIPISSATPVVLNGIAGRVISIVIGDLNACALNDIGQVFCWGYNNNGEVGIGSRIPTSIPTSVF